MQMLSIFAVLAILTQAPPKPAAQPAPQPGDALQVQVMLDRAGFSPGPIDGRMGMNTKKALEALQKNGNTGVPSGEALTPGRRSLGLIDYGEGWVVAVGDCRHDWTR